MELFQGYFNQQKAKMFSFFCGLSLFFCLTFFSCSNIGSFAKFSRDYIDDNMLVMVYVAGANTLGGEVVIDINSMEKGLFNAKNEGYTKLKVVVLADKQNSSGSESWTGTRLYEITPNNSDINSGKIHSKVIETASNSLGQWRTSSDQEEHMGNIKTLENFVLWARENYPYYKKHSLILWNHGGGVFSDYKALRYICSDEESGKTSESLDNVLYIAEIEELLSRLYQKENPLEFLGMDACFMAMYEVAYQFKDCVKYMTFSPATEWGGWNYEYIFSKLDSNKSGQNFAINVVDGYKEAYSTAYPNNTMTAVDLQYADELKSKIDRLSEALGMEFKNDPTSFRENIEKLKNTSTVMHLNDDKLASNLLRYPYYELGSLLHCFSNKNKILKDELCVSFDSNTVFYAGEVISILEKMILKTWLGGDYGKYYLKNTNSNDSILLAEHIPYGISIFFSSKNDFPFHGFYTAEKSGTEGVLGYGCIKAANKNDNADIDTWYELQCALYQD